MGKLPRRRQHYSQVLGTPNVQAARAWEKTRRPFAIEVHQLLVSPNVSSNRSRPDEMTAGGSCIVDVILTDWGTSAQASYEDLARAASEIQQRCVRSDGVGGIATDVGTIFDRFHSICRGSQD